MQIQFSGTTDVGLVRQENEDNLIIILLDPSTGTIKESLQGSAEIMDKSCVAFFVVADGMGGAAAGEIASQIAIDTVKEMIASREIVVGSDIVTIDLLKEMVIQSHHKIVQNAEENKNRQGMGTTLTIGMVVENKLYLAWSGDSRCYRFSPKGVKQLKSYDLENLEILTPDHSVVWEMVEKGEITSEQARTHHQSNVITQSLGEKEFPPSPDFRIIDLFKDDQLLFCSDGLNGMMADFYISQILTQKDSLEERVDALLSAAKAGGGTDNITLIVVDILDGKTSAGVLEKSNTEAVDTKKVEIQTDYVYNDGGKAGNVTLDGSEKEVVPQTPISEKTKETSVRSKAFFFAAIVMLVFTGFLYFKLSDNGIADQDDLNNVEEPKTPDTNSSIDEVEPDSVQSSQIGETNEEVPDQTQKKGISGTKDTPKKRKNRVTAPKRGGSNINISASPEKKDSIINTDTVKATPLPPAVQSILEKIKGQSKDLETLLQQAKGVLEKDNLQTRSPNLIPQVNSLVQEIEKEIDSLRSFEEALIQTAGEGNPLPEVQPLEDKIAAFRKRLDQLKLR